MTNRERLQAVFSGALPDKVPHFELVFQLTEEAFGAAWPTEAELSAASANERMALKERFFWLWEQIMVSYDWAAVQVPTSLGGHFVGELIPEGCRRFGERVQIYDFNGSGTFWMPTGSEMMDFVVKLFERPAELHEEAKDKVRQSVELAKMQVDQGVDFICINSDYGYNQGPFISPAMFAEFVTPYLTEVVAAIHELGVPAILHSDGDLRLILDQLVSTGLDGYQSIDPQGHMDLAAVKRQYGDRLVLMGNVQASLLQDAEEQEIRDFVQNCVETGKPGGRFIFSTSNCVFAGMPLQNYHIMLDEYEKHARYAKEDGPHDKS